MGPSHRSHDMPPLFPPKVADVWQTPAQLHAASVLRFKSRIIHAPYNYLLFGYRHIRLRVSGLSFFRRIHSVQYNPGIYSTVIHADTAGSREDSRTTRG